METPDFAAQFALALDRVLAVVRAAGGEPSHIGRMTIYVTDLAATGMPDGSLARRGGLDWAGTIPPWRSSRSAASSMPARWSRSRRPPSSRDPLPPRGRKCAVSLNPTSFLYEVDAATSVATITLNRPERRNALTFEVYDELRNTFRALDCEPGVRAVVITGAGGAFCTGGDVRDIIGPLLDMDSAELLEFTR